MNMTDGSNNFAPVRSHADGMGYDRIDKFVCVMSLSISAYKHSYSKVTAVPLAPWHTPGFSNYVITIRMASNEFRSASRLPAPPCLITPPLPSQT